MLHVCAFTGITALCSEQVFLWCRSEREKKKTVSHGNRGRTQSSCHAHCLAIGSLSFSAPPGLQTTSCKEDWSIFLNGQIWHCPIRPTHISTNHKPVSTSTRYCRPQGNYCMAVMWKLVAHTSKWRAEVTFSNRDCYFGPNLGANAAFFFL